MQKGIQFESELNTFNDNIFTFDEDDDQPDQNLQSTPQPFNPSSNTHHQQSPSFTNSSKPNPNLHNQIFTFDEQDQQQISQNHDSHQANIPFHTNNLQNNLTQSTPRKESLIDNRDLSDLKSRILFKQQNNFIQKTTPTKKSSPLQPSSKPYSKPQVITKNFQQKVNQLKETLKQNHPKDPILKKIPSDKSSIKNKLSQAYSRKSYQNHSQTTNDQTPFEAFKQNQPSEKRPKNYQIQGAKIVNDEDEPNQQFQYVEEQKAIKVTNLRQFLFTQLAEEYKVNALITRIQEGGFLGKLVSKTKYVVTIEQNNKFLFSVTKDGFNKFIFSMNKDDCSQKNKNYLGQLVSKDFSNTEFILYDNGFDPKETKCLEYCFKQMASIKYEEGSGPRKFSVIVSTNSKGFHTMESQVNILEKKWCEKKQRKNMTKLYSKEPEFDETDGNYKLDFKGMVGKPSVKNFVLSSDNYEDCLIFARRTNDTYALEVKHPFSLVQAVAVCMSSIYHKTIL